uniref:pilus assembly protein n=1 Tax=Pelomonas sp. KK5 TaxID=1855730 RepID=UPI002100D6C1
MNPTFDPLQRSRAWLGGLALLAAALASPARADTDIATAPLFTTSTSQVKPNVMFILDDSGSMASDYLPDDADYVVPARNKFGNAIQYGRRSSQCNGVAYNPALSYSPPKDASGNNLALGSTSFLSGGNAKTGTYNQRTVSQTSATIVSSGTLNLTINVSSKQSSWYVAGNIVTVFDNSTSSTGAKYMVGTVASWDSSTGALSINVLLAVGSGTLSTVTVGDDSPVQQYYYAYSGSSTAMSYRYPGNSLDTSSTFYKECNSAISASPGAGVFTLKMVTAASTEAQNYANWYQYYRTRMLMMQTSTSQAFAVMGSDYRIGFTTISDTGVTEGTTFLNVRDFDSTQKTSFYSKLMGAVPGPYTPLRGALSKVGRYYAKQVSGQTYDPIQYSCQKNFTILSTDGYWNTQDEVSNGTAATNYGPYKFDNTTLVGEQDGGATPRPQYDGNTSTVKTVKTWSATTSYQSTVTTPDVKTDKTTTVTIKYTPTNAQQRTNYSLTSPGFATSTIATSCSNTSGGKQSCTLTVKLGTAGNFVAGQSVTLSGLSVSNFNGGPYTITAVDTKTFTVTITGLARGIGTPGNTGTVTFSGSSCSSGKSFQYSWTETQNKGTTLTSTTISSLDTQQSRTVVTGYSTTTNYTETIIAVNGVQSSDNTTSTSNSTTTPISDTGVVNGSQAPTQPQPTPPANQNGTFGWTAWTQTSTPTVTATCVSSASAATTPVAIALPTIPDNVTTTPSSSTVVGTATTTSTTPTTTTTNPTTTTTTTSSGGSSSSLADVAMFYYSNALRTTGMGNCTGALATSLCDSTQPVVGFGDDTATWLHMSTYTLSLGNSGTLLYDPNYLSQTSGDYANVKSGAANWPVPSSDAGAVNIDDLWHAAVNGRGRYFSATDPSTLASSLAATLSTIQGVKGSSSAAATSTLQPVQGDNGVFVAQFQSQDWTGDLRAYSMDVTTGVVATTALGADGKPVDLAIWSAAAQLSTSTTRNIYYFRPSGTAGSFTGTLQPFVYDTTKMTSTELAYFDNACNKTPVLSQCAGLSGTALTNFNSGANLLSFLRGQPQAQYRTPAKLLGDIVNSSPVYVGKPAFNYTENNYAGFKNAQSGRKPTIYVGANDGMLHAFNAETTIDPSTKNAVATSSSGTERWAYIPRLVMPNLYLLADSFYASKHQYYVDATPAVGDVYDATAGKWRTILVGGLNSGGRGYYALDITDPATPVALWEYTDSSLGYTFGNPVITKRKDGTWIVAFTSGYNNPDGGGHLFVVNAITGAPVLASKTIDTGVGSAGNSSGLNKLNVWVDSDTENLGKRFYAGDLLGNVWRFDIDGIQDPKNAALSIAQLTDASGKAQPITTMPQLGQVDANGGSWAVVYVGTGRYLGKTDVTNTDAQSIYAIKDSLGSTGIGNARSTGAKLVKQAVSSDSPRVIGSTSTPVNWAVNNGWYVDLLTAGERINVDMELSFDMLTAAANKPSSVATDCTPAGPG